MAGDWMKVEHSTPDKPEIFGIAGALDISPDEAFGICFRLWRWFDQHSQDGNARGVTPALLDRHLGVAGFSSACASVGWLIVGQDGISLPNFDRHIGQTAKTRALTYDRAKKHREREKRKRNAESNALSVTEALPENRDRDQRSDDREDSGGIPPETPSVKQRNLYCDEFQKFWEAYPRKQAKDAAFKAWKKAGARVKVDKGIDSAEAASYLLERCLAYQVAKRGADMKFIPHAASWLNAGQYNDDPTTWSMELEDSVDRTSIVATKEDAKRWNPYSATGLD